MKIALILLLTIYTINSNRFAQQFKLTHVLQDLAKLPASVSQTSNASSQYMIDPNINAFLKQYSTRTQFCQYKCPNFLDIPCFVLFGCNIHIRNLVFVFFFPVFLFALTGVCCGKGLWTFSCWLKYLGLFTGARCIVWAIKKCTSDAKSDHSKSDIEKQHEEQMEENQKKQPNINELQIQPKTSDRMNSRRNRSSQTSSQEPS